MPTKLQPGICSQVCELDIIFNFEKVTTSPCKLYFYLHTFTCLWLQAFYMLDELLVGGEIQESSKKNIIRAVTAQDVLQEVREQIHKSNQRPGLDQTMRVYNNSKNKPPPLPRRTSQAPMRVLLYLSKTLGRWDRTHMCLDPSNLQRNLQSAHGEFSFLPKRSLSCIWGQNHKIGHRPTWNKATLVEISISSVSSSGLPFNIS